MNRILQFCSLFIVIQLFSFSYAQSEALTINFSKEGGIYNENFSLKLSSVKDASIYYTIDGSKPTKNSSKFTNVITIDTTKVVRAIARKKGVYSEVVTHSFILEKRRFNLPVVSVAVDPGKMFNSVSGIYMKGLNASAVSPFKGANFHKDRELEINIEYFDTTKELGFNQRAGLKIFGGYSRSLAQKSFSIISRERYGNKDFNYPIYPNLKYKKYKSFILRNSGSDNNRSHFRDILMTSLVKPLSFDIQEYNSCVVFVNGEYFGIYHMREKFNEHYIKQHHGIDKDSVSIMKHRDDLRMGRRHNYGDIITYISKTDFSSNKKIDHLNKLIDINNFLDYNISQTYFANTDAGGNIRYWRSWHDNSRWKWLMFDTDFGFGMDGATAYEKNTVKDFTTKSNERWPVPAWSTLIIRKLLENDSIKEVYVRKFTTYLNTILKPDVVMHKVDELITSLDYEIDFQHKRWGKNRKTWKSEIKRITDFGEYRPYYIRKYLQEKFELTDTFTVSIEKPINGEIIFNNYNVINDFEGIYFSDITNYLSANTTRYYELDKWIGIDCTEDETSFSLTNNIAIKAVFKKKQKSYYFNKLKFTEISFKGDDWIELYNTTDSVIDISNWIFLRDGVKEFFIDSNTFIKGKEYIVFSRKNNEIDSTYSIESIKGLFAVRDTSLIEFYTNMGNLVDSIKLDFPNKKMVELDDLITQSSTCANWKEIKKCTPGRINNKELQRLQFGNFLMFGVFPFLGLILLLSIIFFIRRN